MLAVGTSMGGLVSALEAQDGAGRIDGALTTCGIVAGAINLNNYQLDGEYALARLLLPGQQVQLVRVGHCSFSPAELLAGVLALSHRVAADRWDSAAEPASLDQVASGLGLGPARFTAYSPGPLTGASGPRR